MSYSLAKNALYNLLRGGASAVVALLLPPLLTRFLPASEYGVWALIVQLSALVSFLDFGIQTAVGRYIAHFTKLQNDEERNRIVSSAMAMLSGMAIIGIACMLLISWQMPNLFQEMSTAAQRESQIAILILSSSLAVGLPFSIYNGIFIGLQRFNIPAVIVGGGRLFGAFTVALVAWLTRDVVFMSLALATANFVTYFIQFAAARRFAPFIRTTFKLLSKQSLWELTTYCFSLMIWSFATILITGLDTTIVGVVDFNAVPYYTAAANLITLIVGLQYALCNVLIPAAAAMAASKDVVGLGKLLLSTTRYSMHALLVVSIPLLLFTNQILSLWVGSSYAFYTERLLQVLVLANAIRLSTLPYTNLLIGTGQQKLIIFSPLVEGITNLLFSIVAGYFLGAIGVAIGTLVGACVVVVFNAIYNMPRTTSIDTKRWVYVRDGLLRPTSCFTPFLLFLASKQFVSFSVVSTTIMLLISIIISSSLIWLVGLDHAEKAKIRLILGYYFQNYHPRVNYLL